MLVMKFGGTSVGSAERIRATAEIIDSSDDDTIVVVLSAMSGVTNSLIAVADGASPDDMLRRHEETIGQLGLPQLVMQHVREVFGDAHTKAETVACGEQFSTAIMLAYLYKQGVDAAWLPALEYMRTDADGNPETEETARLVRRLMQSKGRHRVYITQGFIGRGPDGAVSTLSRGGSDFTATLLGEALGAEEVQIWTDVDGVYSADPRIVPEAHCIPRMSYAQADTAARMGARILHPDCVRPALRGGYKLRVLNSFRPEAAGTLIGPFDDTAGYIAVAGIKRPDGLADVSLIGRGHGSDAARARHLLATDAVMAADGRITATVADDCADRAMRILHKEFIEQNTGFQI